MTLKERLQALEERVEALEDALNASDPKVIKVCDFEGECIDCEDVEECLMDECNRIMSVCELCCMTVECSEVWGD